jgi:hypothetical protein
MMRDTSTDLLKLSCVGRSVDQGLFRCVKRLVVGGVELRSGVACRRQETSSRAGGPGSLKNHGTI